MISLVQVVHSVAAGSPKAVAPSSTTAGNLIVVITNQSNNLSTVTDNLGNSYTLAISETLGSNEQDMWYLENNPGGINSISVDNMGSGGILLVAEFSGVALTSSLISTAFIADDTGATKGPSLTPTSPGQLLVSFATSITGGLSGGDQYSGVQAPWTLLDEFVASDSLPSTSAYYINAPLSAQQANFNPTDPTLYDAVGAVFDTATVPLTLSLSDAFTPSDSISFFTNFILILTESLTPSDSLAFTFFLTLNDFIFKIDDVEGTITARILNDVLKINDWISTRFYPSISRFGD